MRTYLPSEGYKNYDVSSRNILHMKIVCSFRTQPYTVSLCIVNQPKTVKIATLLSLFLRSVCLFLCSPWRKPSIANCRWTFLGNAQTAKLKSWMSQEERPYKYCGAQAFLKCFLIPSCSIGAHAYKAHHPEIDRSLSVDCVVCVLIFQVLALNTCCYKELLKLHLNWK